MAGEDTRAVPAACARGQRPATRRAPRDHARVPAVQHREPFITQRDIGPFARFDQVAARGFQRFASIFLVAGQRDDDVRTLERASRLHGAQRGEDHHDAALVVNHARPDRTVALADEAGEGRTGFEHRVEMTDQQHLRGARHALVPREQVACAPLRRLVDPFDVKA